MVNMKNQYFGVRWRGDRTGHLYVSLFDGGERKAAEDAYKHLVENGSLPDFSPGSGLVEPVHCLELGPVTGVPLQHEGKVITFIGDVSVDAPFGAD